MTSSSGLALEFVKVAGSGSRVPCVLLALGIFVFLESCSPSHPVSVRRVDGSTSTLRVYLADGFGVESLVRLGSFAPYYAMSSEQAKSDLGSRRIETNEGVIHVVGIEDSSGGEPTETRTYLAFDAKPQFKLLSKDLERLVAPRTERISIIDSHGSAQLFIEIADGRAIRVLRP
jgi:hypothetical protein